MTILELCHLIELPKEVMDKLEGFAASKELDSFLPQIEDLNVYEKSQAALDTLKAKLTDDDDHLKLLTCMLMAAAKAHDLYVEKGISNSFYIETMKCFTRFMKETYIMEGKYIFDRFWWVSRQLGLKLFRIGELEYELKQGGENPIISVHIPSDAVLTKSSCLCSITEAHLFCREYFPEYKKAEYVCESWLLSPELKKLLPEDSHIIQFQNKFDITETDPDNQEFIEWVFKKRASTPVEEYPEETSLQKSMKAHLLAGGKIGIAKGTLGK